MSFPLLYEINTRCWLRELTERALAPITLANVPEDEFSRWQRLGFTHIWLMGVWTSGARAREQALSEPNRLRDYAQNLPDVQPQDITSSPYAISAYQVPEALGGEAGLASFRRRLNGHGLKLLLDFVPNHMGLDHPWLHEQPDRFVQSPREAPETFLQQTINSARWIAFGKDPNFQAWTDTAQLDYRRADTRQAMHQVLSSIADRCDGVRCDMAMLLVRDVFTKSWIHLSARPSGGGMVEKPDWEFWTEAISNIKRHHPEFLFMAEVYWGMEAHLQKLGFDYTYDKTLYDRLVARDGVGVQKHALGLPSEVLAHGAHFLENHDEPRVAALLGPVSTPAGAVPEVGTPRLRSASRLEEYRAAVLVILGLPGLRLLHEGQLTGMRLRTPVQLLRRAVEPADETIARIYEQVLTTLPKTAVGQERGQVLQPRSAWEGNPTAENFILAQWQTRAPEFDLVVVNLAPHRSQCYALLTIENLKAYHWSMVDLLGEERYVRVGEDLQAQGLYLDLPAHGAQLFHFSPAI